MNQSIKALVEGNHIFRDHFFKHHEQTYLDSLKTQQNPMALFITCSDSRIMPSKIFNTKPGDFFYIRNVGNIVPPYSEEQYHIETPAALEYALNVLEVPEIIICGHKNCGACANLHKDLVDPNLAHLKKWLALNQKTKQLSQAAAEKQTEAFSLAETTERISILCQIENLLTYPFIKEKVEQGKVFLHAWYYQIDTGKIDYYDSERQEYRPLDELML